MTNKNKGKRKASENSSAEHVTFCQSNLALNPPSIYFDKPKKSTEKSDDEGNYKKIEVPIEAGNANSKNIEKKKLAELLMDDLHITRLFFDRGYKLKIDKLRQRL
jgi:hypothetical protein